MTSAWAGEAGLAALFASAFVSATILPGNSEIVLATVLKALPGLAAEAIAVATLGNTLGSLTTYGLGRLVPGRRMEDRATAWVRRFGAPVLLLAWLPLIGDALCAAAGWLRIPLLSATAAIAAGKFARYLLVAQATALI